VFLAVTRFAVNYHLPTRGRILPTRVNASYDSFPLERNVTRVSLAVSGANTPCGYSTSRRWETS